MNPIPINIAVEDELSAAVARRLLAASGKSYSVGQSFGRRGCSYLRQTAQGWNNAAGSIPFFLLTDLDRAPCAGALVSDWINKPLHPNFLFRVAVHEVESWLLADQTNLSAFFGVPPTLIPNDPDQLSDPKSTLVSLARRRAGRAINARIVPKAGSTAKVGRDYNGCLVEFVSNLWNPMDAAIHSRSLERCIARLKNFSRS